MTAKHQTPCSRDSEPVQRAAGLTVVQSRSTRLMAIDSTTFADRPAAGLSPSGVLTVTWHRLSFR